MSIEEIILREDLFAQRALDHHFGDSERLMKEVGINQPEFRTFDEPDPVKTIFWDEDREVFYVDGFDETWINLIDAHNAVEAGRKFDADIDYDSVSKSGQLDGDEGGIYTVASKRRNFHTWISTPIDTRGLETHEYWEFLCTAREWLQNKDDFLLSYYFIDHHPILWMRSRPETHPNQWNTDSGVSKLWMHPQRREDGTICMMMEAGSAVPDARQRRYHDLRLDTYTNSFEEGIVATAALIHKFFDLDGSERKGVDYEKSELEVTLDERLASYQEALDSEDSIQ